MLPMTCSQPPCRNIDVTSVGHGELGRDEAELLQEPLELRLRQRQLEQEHQRVDDDEPDRDDRRASWTG